MYKYLNMKHRAFAAFAWTMATYRMIETAQVLVGIRLVRAIDTGHDEMELGGSSGAYMAPVMNIKDIPIFSFRESCRRQFIGTGKIKMMRSDMKFIDPYASPALA